MSIFKKELQEIINPELSFINSYLLEKDVPSLSKLTSEQAFGKPLVFIPDDKKEALTTILRVYLQTIGEHETKEHEEGSISQTPFSAKVILKIILESVQDPDIDQVN